MSEHNAKSDNSPNIYCVGTQMVVTDKELEILSSIKGIEIKKIRDNLIEIQTQQGILKEEGILVSENGIVIAKFIPKDVKELILNIKQRKDKKKKKKDNEGLNR